MNISTRNTKVEIARSELCHNLMVSTIGYRALPRQAYFVVTS